MLEKLPTQQSTEAADAADRLRLLVCDMPMTDMAMTNTHANGFEFSDDEHQAMLMSDDILTADRKARDQ